MLGNLISRIRNEKGISKTQLSKKSQIDVGHLTHIEQGSRKPSHKALKNLASALDVPYQNLYQCYDKTLDNIQIEYNYINHISYTKIPAISHIDSFIDCPIKFSNVAFAYKVQDNSMAPNIQENTYIFVEINGLVKHKDIGIFKLNGEILIRKLMYKKNNFVLKANDRKIKDIIVSDTDDFQIIGKVYF